MSRSRAARRSAWASPVLRVVVLLLMLVTLLPLIETDRWWVRMLEFPKLQLFFLTAATLALVIAWDRRQATLWAAALSLAFGYQVYRLAPYSPLYPDQMIDAGTCPAEQRVSLMTLNVLQSNTSFPRPVDLVNARAPDIFIALETNQAWIDELADIERDYGYKQLVPLDNTYGMALYSKLPLSNLEVRYIVEPDIPSILTDVTLRSGETVRLLAIHPRPPIPGKDSGTRDAELVVSARDVVDSPHPVIVAGDLNDVPWSPTTRLFRQLAEVIDPRIGRGFYATFNAGFPGMDWPLDHVFASQDFTLVSADTGPDIGSDHRPFIVELCHSPRRGNAEQEAPNRDREAIREGREELLEGMEQQREEMAAGEDETDTPEAD